MSQAQALNAPADHAEEADPGRLQRMVLRVAVERAGAGHSQLLTRSSSIGPLPRRRGQSVTLAGIGRIPGL